LFYNVVGDKNMKKINEKDLKELQRHQVSNFFEALISLSFKTSFEEGIDAWTTER
jgi:hypothetical protein